MICRVVVAVCGIALVAFGFAGWHVNVAAVVIGLILVGCLSGDMLVKVLSRARDGVGSAGSEAHSPPADSARNEWPRA